MKTLAKVLLVAVAPLVCAIALGVLSGMPRTLDAQPRGGVEYGYILSVPRATQYEEEMGKWGGSAADKDYLKGRVFVYETGDSAHSERLNSLKLMNSLADKGWEIVDAKHGVIRRAK